MAVASAYQNAAKYRQTQVDTASPTQLVVMLYDGAIRFLSLARQKMGPGDLVARNTLLLKAQNIITHLISSLDIERGGDVAVNLQRLYTFMLLRIVEANVHDRTAPIDEVVGLLRELRESWVEVDLQQKQAERAAA